MEGETPISKIKTFKDRFNDGDGRGRGDDGG